MPTLSIRLSAMFPISKRGVQSNNAPVHACGVRHCPCGPELCIMRGCPRGLPAR
ncbi:hypothetical protein [Lysobacter gummosus]|uniref:hypothetical protein n=1 Tax=Lysobacter gummosus TaxID=262324 RepID=UPI0036426399